MSQTRYEAIQQLAAGGMGDVVLARQLASDGFERLVALKRVRAEFAREEGYQQLFRNEARVASLLTHPNIVQIYDFGLKDGELFLAMEYVPGRTLLELLRHAAEKNAILPMEAIVTISIDLVRALHYAHELRDEAGRPLDIVHRDLSPANVIVSIEGASKVLDFGIAKATIAIDTTEREVLKGKPGYLSPEQVRLGHADRRSDIFCLGIMLWELTCTDRLYPVSDPAAAVKLIGHVPIPTISSYRKDAPPGWEGILRRALATEPADRYPTASEMQRDIEDVARSAGFVGSNRAVVAMMAHFFPESAFTTTPRVTPTKRMSVLAVDDEVGITELVQRALRSKYDVKTAHSVAEALEILATRPFDVVLTDQRMPGARGVDLLKHVALASPRTIRVMMTAYADPVVMLSAINEGHVHRFLMKPIRAQELLAALDDVTGENAWSMRGSLPGANVRRSNTSESGLITLVEPASSFSVPTPSLDWADIELESAELRQGASCLLLVALTGVQRRAGLIDDCRAVCPKNAWLRACGEKQLVIVVPGATLRQAPQIADAITRVLRDGQKRAHVGVGWAEVAGGAGLLQSGRLAESHAQTEWSKEVPRVS